MKSLFPVGIPVAGSDLVDRKQELEAISQMLAGGQNVILISPRRYGKTSITLEILRRLKQRGFYTIYIDIFTVINKRDLAEQITGKALEYKRIKNFTRIIREKFTQLLRPIEFKEVIKDFQ